MNNKFVHIYISLISLFLGGIILIIYFTFLIPLLPDDLYEGDVAGCGTMCIPENQVYKINLPGLEIYEGECSSCHALRKDQQIIGSSFHGMNERMDSASFYKFIRSGDYSFLNYPDSIIPPAHPVYPFDDSSIIHLRIFIDSVSTY